VEYEHASFVTSAALSAGPEGRFYEFRHQRFEYAPQHTLRINRSEQPYRHCTFCAITYILNYIDWGRRFIAKSSMDLRGSDFLDLLRFRIAILRSIPRLELMSEVESRKARRWIFYSDGMVFGGVTGHILPINEYLYYILSCLIRCQ